MLDLSEAEILVDVVDAGSVSAAARKRGVAQSSVTRSVARLEARLGVRLVDRDSRRLKPTLAGDVFVERARALLDGARSLEEATVAMAGHIAGVVRLSVPPAFGRARLIEPLGAWWKENPGVRLEVRLENRIVDVLNEGIDIAVRLGALPDSTLAQRKLADYAHRLVASPAYLRARGAPSSPADLREHAVLGMTTVGPNTRWPFVQGRQVAEITVTPGFVTNDGYALLDAALSGAGVTVLPDFLADGAIASGALVHLMPGWQMPTAPVSALFVRARERRAVREVLAVLVRACRAKPSAWSPGTSSQSGTGSTGSSGAAGWARSGQRPTRSRRAPSR
jgi:DNA-binding transcriptional LysR family regulator